MIRILSICAMLLGAAAPARAAIEIIEVTSPGGITAWVTEDDTIPIVAIEASFRGGAVLEPEGQAGVTNLMVALLGEGTGERDATAFAEARETLAARFGFHAGRDGVGVSAQVLRENLDPAMELLRDALVEPRFDEGDLARLRAQMLARLRAQETDPGAISSRAFYELAFPGHPYATPVDGTLESVAAIDADAIRAAHRNALVRERLMVSVAGDITAEEVGPMLDRLFGDLPAAAPEDAPDLPEVADPALAGGVTVIDLDNPQSMVVFGHAGLPRDDPDFIAAHVMNHILGGGGFGSRLTEELRERVAVVERLLALDPPEIGVCIG